MKFIRQCPLFLVLLSTGIVFTLLAIGGKSSLYKEQEWKPLEAPLLSVMFTGINEDIYPWQLFPEASEFVITAKEALIKRFGGKDAAETMSQEEFAASPESTESSEAPSSADNGEKRDAQFTEGVMEGSSKNEEENGQVQQASASILPKTEEEADGKETVNKNGTENKGEREAKGKSEASSGMKDAPETEASSETGTVLAYGEGRSQPLRESTHDEYMNHISADIYGEIGVEKAASYEFAAVDESYFDDALFIGDSRTVGLRDYTDLSEHAAFYCETSLTIYKALETDFKNKGTIEEALAAGNYGKIYIMVGINELGRGTTEDFMGKYTEVVDTLHEMAPDALIFVQGIMRVTGDKSSKDKVFNNNNINARNHAIATLADNQHIFYIDVNEAVCDEEGNLNTEYTYDQLHLLGKYNDLWKQFLLSHGVLD